MISHLVYAAWQLKLYRTTSLCSHIFLVLRDHKVYMYVVYIWKWSSAHALGASVVWHHSLLLMNSFNKTEAAVFSFRLCFLRAFLFISLILNNTTYFCKSVFFDKLKRAFHSKTTNMCCWRVHTISH